MQRLVFYMLFISVSTLMVSDLASAYTANKVWVEKRPNGLIRVYVNYTVPALKEFREAYVEFWDSKKASTYYWDLIRGADFFLDDPNRRTFQKEPAKPSPW